MKYLSTLKHMEEDYIQTCYISLYCYLSEHDINISHLSYTVLPNINIFEKLFATVLRGLSCATVHKHMAFGLEYDN